MAYINGTQTFFSTLGTKVTKDGVYQGEWSADFAESERQKSKNLFDLNSVIKGAYMFADGNFALADNYYTTQNKISVKPNSKLILSGFDWNNSCGFCFYNDNGFVGFSKGSEQITVPAEANKLIINFYKEHIAKNDLTNVQLEEGTEATDYQKWSGKILHEEDVADVERIDYKIKTMSETYAQLNSHEHYPSMNVLTEIARGVDNFVSYGFDNESAFLDWVKNSAPIGVYIKHVQTGGSFYAYIIQRISPDYASVIQFDYNKRLRMKVLYAGVWNENWTSFNHD